LIETLRPETFSQVTSLSASEASQPENSRRQCDYCMELNYWKYQLSRQSELSYLDAIVLKVAVGQIVRLYRRWGSTDHQRRSTAGVRAPFFRRANEIVLRKFFRFRYYLERPYFSGKTLFSYLLTPVPKCRSFPQVFVLEQLDKGNAGNRRSKGRTARRQAGR
jgi:hypothetical protein